MKTDADGAQREMTLSEVVDNLPVAHSARDELSAIETENAALREALELMIDMFPAVGQPGPQLHAEVEARGLARAALSSAPTDKVLVDVEKLREIEHSGDMFCPSCGGGYPDHDDNCWLDNIIRDTAGK